MPDYAMLRQRLVGGAAAVTVGALKPDALESIWWSGSAAFLENVASQLERAVAGEVEYLTVCLDGHAVSSGGIDFTKEPGAGVLYALATHPQLEGLGLATRLIGELELRAVQRGISTLRIGAEPDNERALRRYEHLGYERFGTSEASWESQRGDGTRFLYSTTIIEMSKIA